jgi:isopentenyl phosphate kinase
MKKNNLKTVILVKLGGGLIAPKDWQPETADLETINRLAEEINKVKKRLIIAVGSGNFGHKAVERYGIEDAENVNRVRGIARRIGEIVAGNVGSSELLTPHKIWVKGGDGSEVVVRVLNEGKTPILYGDVIEEDDGRWVIYSGEKCLELILPKLTRAGWQVEKVIQTSREEGVWDRKGKVINEINEKNWEQIRAEVGGARGVDMTGGMVHKVLESLNIALNYGIFTVIINGKVRGRLVDALKGKSVPGTVIRKYRVPDGLKQR